MISKDIVNFEDDYNKYNTDVNNAGSKEEMEKVFRAFKEVIKTYVSSANDYLKKIYVEVPSPYVVTEGYNGLMDKGTEMHYKNKQEFYSELDNLLLKKELSEEDKKLVSFAIYILKFYYQGIH